MGEHKEPGFRMRTISKVEQYAGIKDICEAGHILLKRIEVGHFILYVFKLIDVGVADHVGV